MKIEPQREVAPLGVPIAFLANRPVPEEPIGRELYCQGRPAVARCGPTPVAVKAFSQFPRCRLAA